MNRTDLQRLAEARLREAEALLNAGEWSGAYYLAGYAVECGLKACIARLTGLHDFPDKGRAIKSYSHKFVDLLDVAGLKSVRKTDLDANPVFKRHWEIVDAWNEAARYVIWNQAEAEDLYQSITAPTDGVFTWVKNHW